MIKLQHSAKDIWPDIRKYEMVRCVEMIANNDASWWGQVLQFIDKGHWGDIASIAGLLVSLLGFWITISVARRSKSAAEAAKDAAVKARDAIIHSHTITHFSTAIAKLEEIKLLQRESRWRMLPDRYPIVRQMLITIRQGNQGMPQNDHATIMGTIQHLADFERVVDIFLETGNDEPSPAHLNTILSGQIDKLNEILETLKQDRE